MIALKDVARINPPPVKWTGSLVANALITTGNSETENFGVSLNAVRRSEIDRITLGGAYYYGRQKERDSDKHETTIDNWYVLGKYDYFLTKQFYLYGSARVEQDHIADLDLRLTLSAGPGYQWFETPTFNFFTEVGLAWVYEDFKNKGTWKPTCGRPSTKASSPRPRSSSATTRLRRPERRRTMYAISSASAGRSDQCRPNSEDAR